MKKRFLAIVICGAMGAALLAGCGSSSSSDSATATDDTSSAAEDTSDAETSVTLDGTWPEEGVTIGVEVYDTTDEQFLALQEYFDYLEENFNITFMYSESIENSEGELDFISSCASAGCDAIMGYYNVSESEAVQQTIDQGMYYWGGTEDTYQEFKDNDLCVGAYTFNEDENSTESGDYLAGYQMGYSLAEQGITHVFYCNGGVSVGVLMFIERQEGFVAGIEAAQADGYDITFNEDEDIVEGWPGTDDFTSAVGKMLAGDYDGVAVSFNAASLFQPIADAGRSDSISVATIGETNETYYDAVNSGLVTCIVYDCEEVVFANAVVQIVNAVTGYGDATRNDDGDAGRILVHRWTVTDADTFNAIYDYHEDGNFFVTAEDMANMFAGLNEDITFNEISEFYSAIDLETAISGIE